MAWGFWPGVLDTMSYAPLPPFEIVVHVEPHILLVFVHHATAGSGSGPREVPSQSQGTRSR